MLALDMNSLTYHIDYEWAPFIVNGKHLSFREYDRGVRLIQGECSHWGPAIYKWEGLILEG